MDVEIPSLDPARTSHFDESACPTRIFTLSPVPQTALVQVNYADAAHSIT
jgi:hypothetical protein